MKYFFYSIIAIVALAVIAGFFIVGSPARQRILRFDEERIQNLSYLQGQIVQFWQNKSQLPALLDLLKDDLRGVSVPVDPENGQPYEYRAKGELSFELCANFNVPSVSQDYGLNKPAPAPVYYEGFTSEASWQHDQGQTCFERTIDPDYFKLRKMD